VAKYSFPSAHYNLSGILDQCVQPVVEEKSSSKSGSAALALFPFTTLASLYSSTPAGDSDEGGLRERAMACGVVGVVLECLEHFTRLDHRRLTTHSPSSPHSTAGVVRHVLEAENQLDLIRDTVNQQLSNTSAAAARSAGALPTTATSQQQPTSTGVAGPAGASSANYWAKGTGFGFGTTQQQWNIRKHEARKKRDEEMVVAVLDILLAYVQGAGDVEGEF